MRAWRAERFGDPADVLKLVEVEKPRPGQGEALIRVLATNIGLPDLMMVEGRYLYVPNPPVTPGQEIVGIVEEAGEDYPFPVGQRIIGIANFFSGSGGLAEYCLSPAMGAIAAPPELPDEQAAAFLGTFHVAYVGLVNRARLQAADTVLVLGGSGGTGSTAIQLGKALGAKVIATARGAAKVAFCKAQGADHVIDLSSGPLTQQVLAATDGLGVDIIYDTVGTPLIEQALESIKIGGRVVLIGFAGASAFPNIDPLQILSKGISVTGALHSVRTAEERYQAIHTLGQFYSKGRISLPITDIVSFTNAAEAIGRFKTGVMGKLIAKVST